MFQTFLKTKTWKDFLKEHLKWRTACELTFQSFNQSADGSVACYWCVTGIHLLLVSGLIQWIPLWLIIYMTLRAHSTWNVSKSSIKNLHNWKSRGVDGGGLSNEWESLVWIYTTIMLLLSHIFHLKFYYLTGKREWVFKGLQHGENLIPAPKSTDDRCQNFLVNIWGRSYPLASTSAAQQQGICYSIWGSIHYTLLYCITIGILLKCMHFAHVWRSGYFWVMSYSFSTWESSQILEYVACPHSYAPYTYKARL